MSNDTNAVRFCPYCESFNSNSTVNIVEIEVDNFPDGAVAVECSACGLRGMAANIHDEDSDILAVKFWNELYHEIKSVIVGFDMRQAQKQFFRKRRSASIEERNDLQARAMRLEKEYDAILEYVSLPREKDEIQPRLI